MHKIDSIQIENLWGCGFKVKFKCHNRYNFLIGQNGTGKTTVINLIASALTLDIEKLGKAEFDAITILFKPNFGLNKKSITVRKTYSESLNIYDISYEFKNSQREEPTIFGIESIEKEIISRGLPPKILRDRFYREQLIETKKKINEFVSICWLPVHRFNEEERISDEKRTTISIDQKLHWLKGEIIKYFSSLTNEYSKYIVEFQKSTLISVLTPEKRNEVLSFSNSIDVEKEKQSLAAIFDILGVEEKHYIFKIKSHFDKFTQAVREREKNKNGSMSTETFTAIYNTWRSHSLVQEYEELQRKKKKIFAPRDNFIDVMNELFSGRKKMMISEKNEITFQTSNSREVTPEGLSSGEKQLFILLGEAILQRSQSYVYIADEPELSLHVNWQEALTGSITKLNSNAQIIFATHSPDIVGEHSDNVIDMEDVIK